MFEKILDFITSIDDFWLDWAIIILVFLSLTGCTSTPKPPVVVEKPVYHPAWPMPYQVCSIAWKVIIKDNTPYVALSYDDSLTLASCTKDMTRYILDMNSKFCHYRPAEDERCVKDKEKS